MIQIYVVIAVVLVVAGAVSGCLAIFAVGIHSEEKAYSLTGTSPGRVASGVRALLGVYVTIPGVFQQASQHHPQDQLALAGKETRTR